MGQRYAHAPSCMHCQLAVKGEGSGLWGKGGRQENHARCSAPRDMHAQVYMTTKGFDLGSLYCMIKHCREHISGCIGNPTCKAALDCLQGCAFNDQVCQYR